MWPNRDPIQELGGINLYGFAYNDAVDNYDLLGYGPVPPAKKPAKPPQPKPPSQPKPPNPSCPAPNPSPNASDCKLARSTPDRCYYHCDWGDGKTVTIWVPNPTGGQCPQTPPAFPGPNTPAPQPLPVPVSPIVPVVPVDPIPPIIIPPITLPEPIFFPEPIPIPL